MKERPEYKFFTSTSRLVLYMALALGIFFSAAFLVFMLRSSGSAEFPMPDLVGKYYIDVHNDLARNQLRIVIQKKAYPDRAAGVILSQSIVPGASVSVREKVYITVNQPEPMLQMPDLVGVPLDTAKSRLASMPSEEDVYSLQLAAISYVPMPNVPANTVIAQFPAAKENVAPMERAYLLVSSVEGARPEGVKPEPGKPAAPQTSNMESPVGQNIAIAAEMFARRNIEYRIRSVVSPPSFADSGIVKGFETQGNVYLLDVYYKKPGERYKNGLERIDVELDEPGICKGELISGDSSKLFFVTGDRKAAEDKKTPLVFYRKGEVQVKITCGDSTVYRKRFHPEA
ncbi:MAG: PASTA domain-containing protein [Spirochaetia bacterium]|nr:PASTA domain-containing protein [Spirochaetia bacterium]